MSNRMERRPGATTNTRPSIAVGNPSRSSRRAPTPDARLRDPERSRQQLLASALEVFSAKGYAGARVQDIAERAGINKQLITYYFGGKEGLYKELQRTWLAGEETFSEPELSLGLDELVARYVHHVLSDTRLMRLLIWRGLSDKADQAPDLSPDSQDLASMQHRQARGELAPDLDPACVLLAVLALVAAPVALPHMVSKIVGLDPGSPEFEERYAEQLRRIVRHLAGCREMRPAGAADRTLEV
jgi:TetR/AcrR family transcriptional regulator